MKLYIPNDTAALSLGSKAIKQKAIELGYEVVDNGSRGAAWLEPMVEIATEAGRIGFKNIELADLERLDANQFAFDDPSCIGLVDEFPYFKLQNRQIFKYAGIIDPLSIEDYISHNGFKAVKEAIKLGAETSCDHVLKSGLRGRGGAAFPTGIKWNTTRVTDADQKYVVANADEGDGGTFSDRLLMECQPYMLIEGMMICGASIGASKGYIYLRSEYPVAKDHLNEAIKRARKEGILGKNCLGLDFEFDIELRIGAGAYICGEETSLLDSIEGKRGLVRAKPPLPAIEGLFGKPTIINNVITFASLIQIFTEGHEAYADLGYGRSTGTLPLQLGGDVVQGGLVEIEFGRTLNQILDQFSGGTRSGGKISMLQLGGPLGSYLHPKYFDEIYDYEKIADLGSAIGHGGIILFSENVDILEQAKFAFDFCVKESCGKCTPCRIGSIRGSEIMDRLVNESSKPQDDALLEDLFETMEIGSLCAMGGLTPKPIKSLMEQFPEAFKHLKEAANHG